METVRSITVCIYALLIFMCFRDPVRCGIVEAVNNRRLLCSHGKLCAELPSTVCWDDDSARLIMFLQLGTQVQYYNFYSPILIAALSQTVICRLIGLCCTILFCFEMTNIDLNVFHIYFSNYWN